MRGPKYDYLSPKGRNIATEIFAHFEAEAILRGDIGYQLLQAASPIHNRSVKSYRVFHFEVSISAPRLDLGSKSQQILTLARARSIWDFQPLGAKQESCRSIFLTR
jgi:hypothetical protein